MTLLRTCKLMAYAMGFVSYLSSQFSNLHGLLVFLFFDRLANIGALTFYVTVQGDGISASSNGKLSCTAGLG